MTGVNYPCHFYYAAAANMFSMNIPYPVVGSFTRTWVTAPTSLPFWIIGEPDTPICCLIPTIVMICTGAWIKGLIYFVAFPLFFIYAWNYIRWTVKYVGQYRFILPRNRKKVEQMRALRSQVFAKLNELLKATSQAL